MSSKIKAYVFLDTEVFVQANFNYSSPRLTSLAKLAQEDRIQVFLTDLTLREVKANLAQTVNRAVSTRVQPILRNSLLPEVKLLVSPVDGDRVLAELSGQLDAFLAAAKVTVLPVEPRALAPMLDAYFGNEPPFGPGKNKAEFPDALALQTLKNWCDDTGRLMAVVSHDAAVRDACAAHHSLCHFDDLAQYLDAVASEDAALYEFVRVSVLRLNDAIFERAQQAFVELGAFLTDVEGDVEHIELTAMELQDDEAGVEIIGLTHDHALVEMPATLSFTADISYEKPGTGTWDGEDKRMVFADQVEETIEATEERSVGVELSFKGLDAHSVKIERVWIEGSDLELESEHDKDWPYK